MRLLVPPDHAVLRTVARPADPSALPEGLVEDLLARARLLDGLGLAAPQLGEPVRVIVAQIYGRLTPLLNPEITDRHGRAVESEGCLSLPGLSVRVPRATWLWLRYQSVTGLSVEIDATGLDARVLQHEIDHLDGRLILDHLPLPARARALKRVLRATRPLR